MITNLGIAFGLAIAINLLFFIIAFWLKKDLFTDLTYAGTFLITALVLMIILNSYGVNQIIAIVLVAAWSIRLGTFLFIRIYKTKIDHRFDSMRNSFWKFLRFWILQGLTVWVVNMPAYLILITMEEAFSLWSLIPLIFAFLFLIWETIADLQKYFWNLKNKGKFIQKGLWKVSRHPNYFGEYSFWIAFSAFTLVSSYNHWHWFVLVSPLFIMTMIYFISGVPLLEKHGWKTFGKDKAYQQYLLNTPCVVPWIGRKGIKKSWKS